MELSDLAFYADEKYHIQEAHLWTDFPGFSVLTDPKTHKWLALLMRQWDEQRGEEVQRCDIKCGRQVLLEPHPPYVGLPFRMKGINWVGVAMGEETDKALVDHLFDQAAASLQDKWNTMLLPGWKKEGVKREEEQPGDGERETGMEVYKDTAIPVSVTANPARGAGIPPGNTPALARRMQDPTEPVAVTEDTYSDGQRDSFYYGYYEHRDTGIPPERIRQMRRLYVYGDPSFQMKCHNFYRQGKFMEDYEDDQPWNGTIRRYFTSYHDLNIRQLRGYFTWRTKIRKGIYEPIAASLAYIYIYELLNGIGASSAEDALGKMKEFEKGFLDAGICDRADAISMRQNLRRWMLEFAVLHKLPKEEARCVADLSLLGEDAALSALQKPAEHREEEVFAAICYFYGKRLQGSQVIYYETKNWPLFAYRPLSNEQLLSFLVEQEEKGRKPEQNADAADTRRLINTQKIAKTGETQATEDAQVREGTKKAEETEETRSVPEVYSCVMAGSLRGRRLFTNAWRIAVEQYQAEGKNLFEACFGSPREFIWHPLANALYWDAQREDEKRADTQQGKIRQADRTQEEHWDGKDAAVPPDAWYVLDENRCFQKKNGVWKEKRYEKLYFHLDLFRQFVHACDVAFRRYLRCGHYLREKPEEAWSKPYIDEAIAMDRQEQARIQKEQEQLRRKAQMVHIDFSSLNQIREDAAITRDSLLTGEDADEAERDQGPGITESSGDIKATKTSGVTKEAAPSVGSRAAEPSIGIRITAPSIGTKAAESSKGTRETEPGETEATKPFRKSEEMEPHASEGGAGLDHGTQPQDLEAGTQEAVSIPGLDPQLTMILRKLVQDQSVEQDIRTGHLFPSVVTDTINEALFDEVGDNVLEYDGEKIRVVEDYKEELADLL